MVIWFQLSLSFTVRSEAYATENDRTAYVSWWTAVARQLKNRDYRLSFNLIFSQSWDLARVKLMEYVAKIVLEKTSSNTLNGLRM